MVVVPALAPLLGGLPATSFQPTCALPPAALHLPHLLPMLRLPCQVAEVREAVRETMDKKKGKKGEKERQNARNHLSAEAQKRLAALGALGREVVEADGEGGGSAGRMAGLAGCTGRAVELLLQHPRALFCRYHRQGACNASHADLLRPAGG